MMFPGVPVHVHDAYIAGSGLLHGAVSGLATVVDMADTPELAQGELMRFFAEAAWYPTALLPSQGVRWEAVDDSAAQAMLTDGPLTIKLFFRFGAEGLIDTVRAEARDAWWTARPSLRPGRAVTGAMPCRTACVC